jgi:hypothetical protein
VLALAGVRTSLAAGPITGVTVSVALAALSPGEDTLSVADPSLLGVSVVLATPLTGVIGDAGLKLPDTPLSSKVSGVVAFCTVLPLASCTVAL